jgi:hypothetical protein
LIYRKESFSLLTNKIGIYQLLYIYMETSSHFNLEFLLIGKFRSTECFYRARGAFRRIMLRHFSFGFYGVVIFLFLLTISFCNTSSFPVEDGTQFYYIVSFLFLCFKHIKFVLLSMTSSIDIFVKHPRTSMERCHKYCLYRHFIQKKNVFYC